MNEQLNFMKSLIAGLEAIETRIANLEVAVSTIMAKEPQNGERAEDIMTIDEAAHFLGYAPSTIKRFTNERTIPHHKRNKRLYFVRAELTSWMLADRIKTDAEVKREASDYTRKNNKK